MERALRHQCAICGGSNLSPKLSVHRAGETFSIVECAKCGHVFVADPPADTANHVDIDKIGWGFRPRHYQIRRLLLARLRPGSSVLEIGCGRGEIGRLLRNDPFQYSGYEPANGLADFGIREGVPIRKEIYTGGERADAVILDNVLEHVAEPGGVLKTAADSILPGGVLIVITPNLNDIRAVSPAWRRRHLWVPPDHINFFSADDISNLFAIAGLNPMRFKFAPLSWSDYRFFPRAVSESLGLSIFGHNVYSVITA